jgi:hypothetical protein
MRAFVAPAPQEMTGDTPETSTTQVVVTTESHSMANKALPIAKMILATFAP